MKVRGLSLNSLGIPIRWDHRLTHIEQPDGGVEAIFANEFIDSDVFLIGGDSFHSATRQVLFGEKPITSLGLTLVRCALFPSTTMGASVTPLLNSIGGFRRAASVLSRTKWSTAYV